MTNNRPRVTARDVAAGGVLMLPGELLRAGFVTGIHVVAERFREI